MSINNFEILGETAMPADTDEHDVLAFDPNSRAVITHTVDLLLNEYADPAKPVRLRFYKEIEGVFYLRGGPAESPIGGDQTYTPGTGGPLRYFLHGSVTKARWRVTAQSSVAEAAPRTIRWRYGYRV